MALKLRRTSASRVRLLSTLIAVFALLAQPMYGFVASQVANAATLGTISGVDASYTNGAEGGVAYTGIYVGFTIETNEEIVALEVRANRTVPHSMVAKAPLIANINAKAGEVGGYGTGGTLVLTGSRQSGSWEQLGVWFGESEPMSIDVIATLKGGAEIVGTDSTLRPNGISAAGALPDVSMVGAGAYYVATSSFKGVSMDFSPRNIDTAEAVEIRFYESDGVAYKSIFGVNSLVNNLNKGMYPTVTGSIIVQPGTWKSPAWQQPVGGWQAADAPQSAEVIITLADGRTIASGKKSIGSTLATAEQVMADTVSPVVTVTPGHADGVLSGTVDFTISVNDARLDASKLRNVPIIFSKQSDWNQRYQQSVDLSSGSATITVNTKELVDGVDYRLRVPAFTDLAGNNATGGSNTGTGPYDMYFNGYSIDNTAPKITRWIVGGVNYTSPYALTDGKAFTSKNINVQFQDNSKLAKVVINGHEIVSKWSNPRSFDAQWYMNQYAKENENIIVLYDDAGNTTTYTFIIDTILPEISIQDVDPINPKTATIVASDAHLNRIDVSLWKEGQDNWVKFPGEWVTPVGSNYSVDYAGESKLNLAELGDGKYEIRATASDTANNAKNAQSVSFVIDRTAPEIVSTVYSATNKTLTVVTNEDANDVTLTVDVASATLKSRNGNTWVFDVASFSKPGATYKYTATATDVAGNTSTTDTANAVTNAITRRSFTIADPFIGGPSVPLVDPNTPGFGPVANPAVRSFFAVPSNVVPVATEDAETDVLGARDAKTASPEKTVAVIEPSAQGWKLFGFAWFWWVLLGAAIAAGWWMIAAARRRRDDAAY